MKKISILFCLFSCLGAGAQDKYDNHWMMGYPPNSPSQMYGGTMLSFFNSNLEVSPFDIIFFISANASISNREGNLLFYTNGCAIANAAHALMQNGETINEGVYHDAFCGPAGGYPRKQGVLILPFPEDEDLFILFHEFRQDFGELVELRYTAINMNTADGLGQVVEKNIHLATDFMADMLTAVRHGNGRDWWIIVPVNSSDRYLRFLLSPTGTSGPDTIHSGQLWDYRGYNGQAVFSPDGSRYVRANPYNGVHILGFDRCAGAFNSAKKIEVPDEEGVWGVAISPNSRYLYMTTLGALWQADLWAPNTASSLIKIAEYDGYVSPFPTRIFQPMLAADGKIYITTSNGTNVLHVIHQPDQPGAACQFEQHGVLMPTYHAFNAPNFPHFRLYDLSGGVCDTLGINGPSVGVANKSQPPASLQAVPNPADASVRISAGQSLRGEWVLYSAAGQPKRRGNWEGASLLLDTSELPAGVWYLVLRDEAGHVHYARFVVAR